MSERRRATPGRIAPLALAIKETLGNETWINWGAGTDKALKRYAAKIAISASPYTE